MNLLKWNLQRWGCQENCIDLEALNERNFPLDVLLKELSSFGKHADIFVIPRKHYDECVEQLGSKIVNDGLREDCFFVIGPFGRTKIVHEPV